MLEESRSAARHAQHIHSASTFLRYPNHSDPLLVHVMHMITNRFTDFDTLTCLETLESWSEQVLEYGSPEPRLLSKVSETTGAM